MPRTHRTRYTHYTRNSRRTRDSPAAALGFLISGLAALCLAVFYPVGQVLGQVSAEALVTDGVFLTGTVVATTIGLLAVALTATVIGMMLLVIRL